MTEFLAIVGQVRTEKLITARHEFISNEEDPFESSNVTSVIDYKLSYKKKRKKTAEVSKMKVRSDKSTDL